MRQTNLTGESAEYLSAREELRQGEIELMRQRERVAELRRWLPLGPAIDQRGIDLLSPVWHLLDLTRQGRGDWFAALDYPAR